LEEAYEELHKQGGRPPKLKVSDRLVITLGYYREYRTMQHIVFNYNVAKSRISDAVNWVTDTPDKSANFTLSSKRELTKSDTEVENVIVDARKLFSNISILSKVGNGLDRSA